MDRKRITQSRRRPRRGVSILEFALILPIFLLLVVGLAELATVLFVRHTMLNAARDAARSLSIREVNSAGAIALAESRLPSSSITFTVTASADGDGAVDRWVQVSTPFSEAALGDPLRILGGGDLAVRVTMRQED
jgi:Flp pilus assembly protein TadG